MYKFENFGREALREFLQQEFKVEPSQLTLIEGIHYCRGSLMEKSKNFDRDKLLKWLAMQLPILVESQSAKESERKATIAAASHEKSADVDEILQCAQYSVKSRTKLLESFQKLEETLNEERSRQGLLG